MLAPFDNTEDFSTASLLKNKGANLTLENLANLSPEQMVREILKKAGILEYERLVRIFRTACNLAKKPLPKEADLINQLVTQLCLVSSVDGLLICKSHIKYDIKSNKRAASLRDYMIVTLEKHGSYRFD